MTLAKEVNMLEIFLGQIPEAIFFELFMIFVKDLKEKRILFTTLKKRLRS